MPEADDPLYDIQKRARDAVDAIGHYALGEVRAIEKSLRDAGYDPELPDSFALPESDQHSAAIALSALHILGEVGLLCISQDQGSSLAAAGAHEARPAYETVSSALLDTLKSDQVLLQEQENIRAFEFAVSQEAAGVIGAFSDKMPAKISWRHHKVSQTWEWADAAPGVTLQYNALFKKGRSGHPTLAEASVQYLLAEDQRTYRKRADLEDYKHPKFHPTTVTICFDHTTVTELELRWPTAHPLDAEISEGTLLRDLVVATQGLSDPYFYSEGVIKLDLSPNAAKRLTTRLQNSAEQLRQAKRLASLPGRPFSGTLSSSKDGLALDYDASQDWFLVRADDEHGYPSSDIVTLIGQIIALIPMLPHA